MRGRYKKWAAPYLSEHSEIVLNSIDEKDEFFSKELCLEIGGGKGDFALALTENEPDINLVSLERDISIAGTFAKKAVNKGISNLRIIASDFDEVYEELRKFKFRRIYLNFSDPWPKKRHEKRRLTVLKRLEMMNSLLEDDGEIRIKTDNDGLYAFTLEQIAIGNFEIIFNEANYKELAKDDYMSEYERNFRALNKNIHRVIIKKKEQ